MQPARMTANSAAMRFVEQTVMIGFIAISAIGVFEMMDRWSTGWSFGANTEICIMSSDAGSNACIARPAEK